MSLAVKKDYSREDVNRANIEYHNAMAERYDERLALFHPKIAKMYEEIFEKYLFNNLSFDQKYEVLDVACGTGLMEYFLARRKNLSVTAFDISPKMIDVAKKLYPQVSFLVGDAYQMPVEKNKQYDFVIENGALHHIKDYFDVIQLMAAKVKPGGKIYFGCEPNATGFNAFSWCRSIYRKLAPEKRIEEATGSRDSELEMVSEYHQFFSKGLSPNKIKSYLENLGFENVQIFYRAEHFIAQLYDSTGLNFISWLPTWMIRLHGPLALNFHLVAKKK